MPLFPVFSFRLLQSELFNVEKVTFYCDVRAQLSGLRSSFRPSLPRKQNRRLGSHVSREAALGLSYALAKGKHFTREEFVSMLLTSVNDIDSRFEGSKTSGGTINLEKYRGKMGTGLTDAYQLLMQIEGTPCLKVKTGKLELVTLTKHFGGSAKDVQRSVDDQMYEAGSCAHHREGGGRRQQARNGVGYGRHRNYQDVCRHCPRNGC